VLIGPGQSLKESDKTLCHGAVSAAIKVSCQRHSPRTGSNGELRPRRPAREASACPGFCVISGVQQDISVRIIGQAPFHSVRQNWFFHRIQELAGHNLNMFLPFGRRRSASTSRFMPVSIAGGKPCWKYRRSSSLSPAACCHAAAI
jgi:hypothetical protein